MPQIEFEGVGVFDYPDTMSEEQAVASISKQFGGDQRTAGDLVKRGASNVVQSFAGAIAAIPEQVALYGAKLQEIIPLPWETRTQAELRHSNTAEAIRDFADVIAPVSGEKPAGLAGFLTDSAASGVGSGLAFVTSATIGRALKIPLWLSTSTFGAAANGVEAYREAVKKGASDEDAFKVLLAGNIIGTSEVIPIARWLKFHDANGKLKQALITGSEELLQEFGQQVSNNIAAQKIYDPQRPWLEGAAEGGAAGFTVGALFSALASAVAGKRGQVKTPAETDPQKTAAKVAPLAPAAAAALAKEPTAPTFRIPLPETPPFNGPTKEVKPAGPAAALPGAEPSGPAADATVSQSPPALPPGEKAGLQSELDVSQGVAEETEVPVVGDADIPMDQVRAAVSQINAESGEMVSKIVVQDTGSGAGVSSASRAGEFTTLVVDPVRLQKSIDLGLPIKEAVQHEIFHNSVGSVLYDDWIKKGSKGEFSAHYDSWYNLVHEQMTAREREATIREYGAPFKSNVELAAEYMRMLLERKYSGKTTEGSFVDLKQPSALRNMFRALKQAWTGKNGKPASPLAKEIIGRVDKLLKQKKANVKATTVKAPAPAVAKAKVTPKAIAPAAVESAKVPLTAQEKTDLKNWLASGRITQEEYDKWISESNAAEAGAGTQRAAKPATVGIAGTPGGVQSSPGSVLPSQPAAEAVVPAVGGVGQANLPTQETTEVPEATAIEIHDAASRAVNDRMRHQLTDAELDIARVSIEEEVARKASAYYKKNGSMKGFAIPVAIRGAINNAYNAAKALKRGGGQVVESLDAPVGEGETGLAELVPDAQPKDIGELAGVVQRLLTSMPAPMEKILRLSMAGGQWKAAFAKAEGITIAQVNARLKAAEKAFKALGALDPEATELFSQEDLLNAAAPYAGVLPPLARDLSVREKLQRFLSPGNWGAVGYLRQVARSTQFAPARDLINNLADRIELYYDQKQNFEGSQMAPIHYFRRSTTVAEQRAAQLEFIQFNAVAQARDGGLSLQQSWANALAIYPQLSRWGKFLVDMVRQQAIDRGRIMTHYDVHVMDEGEYRRFVDLGEKYFPRVISQAIMDILSDQKNLAKHAQFEALMNELVAHNPTLFKDVIAARDYWTRNVLSGIAKGDHFAGVDLARGIKLPDRWYDYSLEAFIRTGESWSRRMAQIVAFGQDLPQIGSQPLRQNLFKLTGSEATMQQDAEGRPGGLKDRIAKIEALVLETTQHQLGEGLQQAAVGIATVRYLTATMTMLRNALSQVVVTSESFGAINTLKATTTALYEAARAIGKTVKAGKIIPSEVNEVARAAGAIRNGLLVHWQLDLETQDRGLWRKITDFAMAPNQFVESWARGMNALAARMWLEKAATEFAHNPTSRASQLNRGLVRRWGFTAAEEARLFRGETEALRKWQRVSVKEKAYGYQIDQMPAAFKAKWSKLLVTFMSWGVQRQRDIALNVIRPMLHGDVVDGVQGPRNAMPFVRLILATLGGAAFLNVLKDALFDRRQKDPSWDEIVRTKSENQKRAFMLGMWRVMNDLTAYGAMGILGDQARVVKDQLTPGRRKSFATAPGLQLITDLSALVQSQVEREGDLRGFYRDFWDLIVNQTPLAKEAADASLAWPLAKMDSGRIKAAREDVGVGRALLRRWSTETGREADLRKAGSTLKNPNTELYTRIYEALVIGDTVEAGHLINEATNNHMDRKKLQAISSSMRGRSPLAIATHFDATDKREFLAWAKRRAPEAADDLERIISTFEVSKRQVGLR